MRTAIAAYILLLGAHARGLAGYWRTPAVLRTQEGRDAVALPSSERVLGLIHLGPPRQEKAPPQRPEPGDVRDLSGLRPAGATSRRFRGL